MIRASLLLVLIPITDPSLMPLNVTLYQRQGGCLTFSELHSCICYLVSIHTYHRHLPSSVVAGFLGWVVFTEDKGGSREGPALERLGVVPVEGREHF